MKNKKPFKLRFKAFLLRRGFGRFIIPKLHACAAFVRKSRDESIEIQMEGIGGDVTVQMNKKVVARGPFNDFIKEAQVWHHAFGGAAAVMDHIDQVIEQHRRKEQVSEILENVRN